VLVLGSGAAGCSAALAAVESGARVLLVDKAKLEGSGSICGGNDHFMANLNTGPDWDTDDAIARHLAKGREGYSADMIRRRWVEIMPLMIQALEESGLRFVKRPDGSYLRTPGFAQPGDWWMNIENGQYIKKFLAKKLRSTTLDVLDNVMLVGLVKKGNRIAGAYGFNVIDGSFHICKAKTIVIALGREANRASLNSSLSPFNTMSYPYNTGSNNVLAYRAGAKLRNVELNDFATLIPKGFGCPGMNGLNSMGGHELNALGERFMGKYDPEYWENTVRAKQVIGTHKELIAGNGPPFYMDMRHLEKNDIAYLQNVLMPGDKATFLDYLDAKGIQFATHKMEIEISEMLYGGRLAVDDNLESTVPGLFSGCNFHFLSGAMCGGYSAGLEAAKAAARSDGEAPWDAEEVADCKEETFRFMANSGLSPAEFESAIRQIMMYYMGLVRNGDGLRVAEEKLELVASHAGGLKARNLHELMRAHEALHLLQHCQLSVRASQLRQESGRTLYRRADFPELNQRMDRCLDLWQEDGRQRHGFDHDL
jgi:succinate dehydrogenase/fumarate reductase flavoprotein subunit